MAFAILRTTSKKVYTDALREKAQRVMSIAVDEAADAMREVIATDMLTDASKARGGGRIETQTMLDAVQSTPVETSESGKSYKAQFGWSTADRRRNSDRIQGGTHDEEGREVKSYFDLQDWGFNQEGSGRKPVLGMHSQELARRKYREAMKREWQR